MQVKVEERDLPVAEASGNRQPRLGGSMNYIIRLCLAALLLLAPAGCGNSEKEELQQALTEQSQELQACQELVLELEDKLQALAELTKEPLPPDSDSEEKDKRIKQLEYTLNRAYIDMKAALLEREEFQKELEKARRRIRDLEQRLHSVPGAG
jgi:septal ring factor EnvC (AmiA/AmiB activator)